MTRIQQASTLAAGLLWTSLALASQGSAELHAIDANGIGPVIGTVALDDSPEGLVLTPNLTNLTAGLHGFHIHENGACDPGEKDGKSTAGMAAGSHFDPDKSGKHSGPDADGHKGDLPVLTVTEQGTAATPTRTKRLHLNDVMGRSLVIHAEADNYSDKPGGARVACGIIR